jgi:hypothetical protein
VSRNKADLMAGLTKPRNPIETNAQTSEHTQAPVSEPSNTQTDVSANAQTVIYINGSMDERRRRYSFDLPDSLHLQLKIHAASQRKTMSDIVEESLRQYLK